MDKTTLQKLLDMALSFLGKKAEDLAVKEVSAPVKEVVVHVEAVIVAPQASIPEAPKTEPAVDWSNSKSRLSANFSVGEALTLPSWGAMHIPSDSEKEAILSIAAQVTKAILVLAKELNKEIHINVHAWIRPGAANIPGSKWNGKDYNRYIYETQVWKGLSAEEIAKKHVPDSPHKTGHAIDFNVIGFEGAIGCAKVRAALLPHLEELGLRMEDLDGGWVHLDNLPIVNKRFFKP